MTKKVRIENADTSSHEVRVFTEDKGPDGEWKRSEMQIPVDLNTPTALTEQYIHSTRRIVIEEG